MFGFGKKKSADAQLNNPVSVSLEYGGEKLTIETGRFAKQASGSVMVTMGETMVLAAAVVEKTAVEGQDFFPLTVDYQEKFSANGKIPGSRDRREGRANTSETLTARLIDRPIRPLFPENFKNKVQITATVFSYDKKNQPDIVAMIASSAALAISGAPFLGPIGAARVGYDNGKYILNPDAKTISDTEMDLIVAATKDGVLMVESEIGELDEKTVLGAVKFGFDEQQKVIKAIGELVQKAGKPTMEVAPISDATIASIKAVEVYRSEIEDAFKIADKMDRYVAMDVIIDKAKAELVTAEGSITAQMVEIAIDKLSGEILRSNILAGKPRIDGRDNKTVRPIEIELGILPRAHGSVLFTRGETQALVSLTLGGGKDGLPIDAMVGQSEESFIMNYNFPGYSVGEAKMLKSPGRREIGHGNLALRAVRPMVPARSDFDYVIRIVSEILESNGSSSMATACGATLAMMDGGVPMLRPVAGIAMGLIKEDKDWAVLTDILGDEDHLGDMDFKVCGTENGITALQMDIKITSITFEIMEKALSQAKDGRIHILGKMKDAIKKPNALSEHAPQAYTMKIPSDKIRDVIGKGGIVIQGLVRETGAIIDLADDGTVKIMATSKAQANDVMARIKTITAEPEEGVVYAGVVSGVKDFGLFVKFFGENESLVHISEITGERLDKIEDAKLSQGDKVFVKYMGKDKRGKTRLSMVGIDQKSGKETK